MSRKGSFSYLTRIWVRSLDAKFEVENRRSSGLDRKICLQAQSDHCMARSTLSRVWYKMFFDSLMVNHVLQEAGVTIEFMVFIILCFGLYWLVRLDIQV